jgi:hypothetical protein
LALAHLGYDIGRLLQIIYNLLGIRFSLEIHLLAVDAVQPGGETAALFFPLGQLCINGPILHRHKGLDLPLPFDDEAQSYRLHPPGRGAVAHILPEKRADFVAHQAVQDAPGLLSVDQLHVNIAGMRECFVNGVASDLVEDHPPHLILADFGRRHEVPGDSFPLAVGVCSQVYLASPLDLLLQFLDHVPLLIGHAVRRLEVVLHVHAEAGPE